MEERDDGIGSEINTPRDASRLEEQHGSGDHQENGLNEVGYLVASYSPLATSTPVSARRQQISHDILGISPIGEISESAHADDVSASGDLENDGMSGRQFTKLDLAVKLRDKQLESIQLREENERISKLLEKVRDENRHFQDKVTATEVYAATLAEEKERLEKAMEEKDAKIVNCEQKLCIAEQKLSQFENITIDVETVKMPDAETLRKLQDENAEMKTKISELELALAVEEEREKNLELWRNKCVAAEKHLKEMHNLKSSLEKELDSKQAELEELKNNRADEKSNKFKELYEENVGKVADLQNQLMAVTEKLEQFRQDGSKVAELERQKKAWEVEREHLQKEKSGLAKRVEDLALANFALTKEKQSLLEADNKGLKDVVAWQEKTKNLTVLNAQLVDELKKYRDVESRLKDCLDELSKKDSLIDEMNEQIAESRNDVKRFRDETVYLRAQLNEKAKAERETSEAWIAEKEQLLAECKRLKETKADTAVEQIASEKQKSDELTALLEKKNIEIQLLEKRRKKDEYLNDENGKLRCENEQLKMTVDRISEEYRSFRDQAEIQYQAETAQMKQMLREKDERLDRLLARIALYESYPGRSSFSACSDGSDRTANITVWEVLPAAVRTELSELKEKYQDLNGIVHRMMADHPTVPFSVPSKIVENKSTNCVSLIPSVHSSHSGSIQRSESHQTSDLAIYNPGSSIETSSESLCATLHPEEKSGPKEVRDPFASVLDSVRHAEIRGKLSPNIQQLLEHLLCDVQQSDKSVEQIEEAVNRFFTNLDLALRKTLSASDDNRVRCEKLENLCKEGRMELRDAQAQLRAAFSKCALYEASIDSLKLQLRCESRSVAELHGKLERAYEEIDSLSKQKDDLNAALSEAKLMLRRKTDLGVQAAGTLKCYEDQLQEAKKFEDLMNERLRTMCKEKEKTKRLLSERELDIVKLECRLVDSTNECTVRAAELQRIESKVDELQKRNVYLKRKYDKREGFLEEMETLLRAMKIRCDGLREANRLRQSLIEKLKKFLVKLGFDLDDPHFVKDKKAIGACYVALKKNKECVRLPHLERLKFAKLAQHFEKDASKIEELEKSQEDDDVVHIPSWRSLNTSMSTPSAGSRTDVRGIGGRNSRAVSENGFSML